MNPADPITSVAVACESADGLAGNVSGHFGHTPYFVVAELTDGAPVSSRLVASPGHGPGCGMPAFVAQLGVGAVLVGGIGPGAIDGLGAHDIRIVGGVTGNAGAALAAFAKGTLIAGDPSCGSHDHGHGHGGGGCGHHHH
jgi:predicted Fe-Mo cluster-binding NifX family protein